MKRVATSPNGADRSLSPRRILPTAATLFERLPRVLRRHRLMRAWMSMTGEDPLQSVRIRDCSFGYADMSDGFLRLIVIEQNFEHEFFRIADSLLGAGGVFFDVGANYGLLSFGLAGRHGNLIDLHLFEPNASLAEIIERTRSLYPLARVSVNVAAVAGDEGTLLFAVDRFQSGASHIATTGDNDCVAVDAVTLDRYIERRAISRVDLLKLDVEGFELLALKGARKALEDRAIQAVYFEYFEKLLVRVAPPRELIQFFDGLEFEVCFCRKDELGNVGGVTHRVLDKELHLRPVRGHQLPAMADLMAVPRERLVSL